MRAARSARLELVATLSAVVCSVPVALLAAALCARALPAPEPVRTAVALGGAIPVWLACACLAMLLPHAAQIWALCLGLAALLSLLLALAAGPARAACARPGLVDRVQLHGNAATADATLLELLPRQPPASYSPAEIAEFERRLGNLAIFDAVSVECDQRTLQVWVREKWTLVPQVDFSSGKTLADSYALLGAIEYNLLGTANRASVSVYRERGGFGVSAEFAEHEYHARGWAFEGQAAYGTTAPQLEPGVAWKVASASLEIAARSPPWLSEHFNYVAGVYGSAESVGDSTGGASPPPSSRVLQTLMGFSWDAYHWHDLVPRGVQGSLWLSVGGLFAEAAPEPRHSAELQLRAALPLGALSVLMARFEAVAGTRGNINYGFPLGSVAGVRGLADARYFDWAHAFGNLEARSSLMLGERWALQGVLFTDAAAFEPMTERGTRGRASAALSAGGGVRLVPTWLSGIILRLDVARLVAPGVAWFAQVGLTQYF